MSEHMMVERGVRTIQGRVHGATIRDGATLVVQGSVEGHVTVESGGSLVVQGALGGSLSVESGAVVQFQGAFGPSWVENAGAISLSGAIAFLPEGTVIVGVGSVLNTRQVSGILTKEGNVVPIPSGGDTDVHVNADDPFFVYRGGREFEPLPP